MKGSLDDNGRRRTARILLAPAAALALIAAGVTPAAATPAPAIPAVIRTVGTVTESLYIQRHIIARIPSLGPDATRAVAEALATLVCARFPRGADQCTKILTALAERGGAVTAADAKAKNSCLRLRYPRNAPSPVAMVFYEDHNPAYCLRDVYGAIGEKWMDHGGRGGFLGYALTDETGTPNRPGRFNHFRGGSVYWSPATGAHEVHGAIKDRWAALGWENSPLGFPTSDEFDIPGGRRNTFENGCRIDWYPDRGVLASCG